VIRFVTVELCMTGLCKLKALKDCMLSRVTRTDVDRIHQFSIPISTLKISSSKIFSLRTKMPKLVANRSVYANCARC